MKILVICQYYYPEPFRITDICEELVLQGHEITVVCGIPNYPMGHIYEGYLHGEKRAETINGVKVYRTFTIGRRSGAIWRFFNYYSYALSSTKFVAKLKDEYDIVFVNQLSPVMMAKAGIKYKKKYNKKLVLYCLDLWPESLVVSGIKKNSVLYKYYHLVSRKIYNQADSILITSRYFSKYFEDEFDIKDTRYLPQYAEAVFLPEMCTKIPNDTVDLMFAGNIGIAQSVDTIIKAADLTRDISNLRWHIVGDGSEVERCKELAADLRLDSVCFYGRQSLEKMPEYYAKADAMLVTMQNDAAVSRTLPGKIQTYMAAGKPILGAVAGEARRVIEEAMCGICCEAGDYIQLAKIVLDYMNNGSKYNYSKNAEQYYKKHFTKKKFICDIKQQFKNNS